MYNHAIIFGLRYKGIAVSVSGQRMLPVSIVNISLNLSPVINSFLVPDLCPVSKKCSYLPGQEAQFL